MAKKRTTKSKRSSKKNRKGLFIVIALIVATGVSYLYYRNYQTEQAWNERNEVISKIPLGFASTGIDVSHHQGDIDWRTLFQTLRYDTIIDFVYLKATEGLHFVDPTWQRNRDSLSKLEVPNGGYHFFTSNDDPIAQAKHFLANYELTNYDLTPVLDVEQGDENPKKLIRDVKKWLKEVEHELGEKPMIYTSVSIYENILKNSFPNYRFWIASYSGKPSCIEDGAVVQWQFSDSFELLPLVGKFDVNVSKEKFR